MRPPGETLIQLAAASQREFVMCAPFAKERAVSEVLSAVPEGVQIALFTRWRPDEVAAGVSDTEVLSVVSARGGVVYLHDRLHAKYYRNEKDALVGSANLTATALGWIQHPNLELLVCSDDGDIDALERDLAASAVVATDELAAEVEEIASLLPAIINQEKLDHQGDNKIWMPELRMPSDLYVAYVSGTSSLASRSAEAAAADLFVLDLPSGLNREQFNLLVGHRLQNQPIFTQIDEYLDESRRFGEMRELLSRISGLEREKAQESWQTIIRWMLEFLPKRYSHSTFRYSEVISLIRPEASAET